MINDKYYGHSLNLHRYIKFSQFFKHNIIIFQCKSDVKAGNPIPSCHDRSGGRTGGDHWDISKWLSSRRISHDNSYYTWFQRKQGFEHILCFGKENVEENARGIREDTAALIYVTRLLCENDESRSNDRNKRKKKKISQHI